MALKKPTISNTSRGVFGCGKPGSGFNTPVYPGSTPKSSDRPVDISQILGTSNLADLSEDPRHDMSQHITNTTL